jgi:hypothetical protein
MQTRADEERVYVTTSSRKHSPSHVPQRPGPADREHSPPHHPGRHSAPCRYAHCPSPPKHTASSSRHVLASRRSRCCSAQPASSERSVRGIGARGLGVAGPAGAVVDRCRVRVGLQGRHTQSNTPQRSSSARAHRCPLYGAASLLRQAPGVQRSCHGGHSREPAVGHVCCRQGYYPPGCHAPAAPAPAAARRTSQPRTRRRGACSWAGPARLRVRVHRRAEVQHSTPGTG